MILPIYASLERLDVSLIEAGKDLYHGPVRTFFTVTLPATRAGLYGGMLLVFLPALGDFVSAQLLGGASTFMIGNLVQQQFVEGQNWPLGSAMTVAMMVALTVLMVVYLRATLDQGAGALMARAGKLERKPLFAVAVTVVFFAWLYLPILAVALFSFNDKKSLSTFSGFSMRWYDDLVHNERAARLPRGEPQDRHHRDRSARSCSARCWRWASSGSGRDAAGSSGRSRCSRSSPPRSSPGWPRCCSSPGSGSSCR